MRCKKAKILKYTHLFIFDGVHNCEDDKMSLNKFQAFPQCYLDLDLSKPNRSIKKNSDKM